MKYIIFSIITFIINGTVRSQSPIITKEIKISYVDGYKLVHVCISNPVVNFSDNKSYYWLSDQSRIKSTKGGSGGKLLHGNLKSFDIKGNLREDTQYNLGLKSGISRTWDSVGNIESTIKYEDDDIVYWKQKYDEGTVENIGKMFKEGWIKKSYNQFNELVTEEEELSDYKRHIKTYYTNENHSLQEDYYVIFDYKLLIGKYVSYYEGGKISLIGEFYDSKNIMPQFANIKIGNWISYNTDGSITQSVFYKPEILYWGNGQLKSIGSYIRDSKESLWQKSGEWRTYSEEGKLLNSQKYHWGIEIE